MNLANLLNPVKVRELARYWLAEDVPSFDIQGFAVGSKQVKANVYCKEPGVLAGIPFANAVCEELGLEKPIWLVNEGTFIGHASPNNRITVATLTGPAKMVLLAERTMLNTLARCSGIATRCYRIKTKLDQVGWKGQLVGTRKTTPGFRMVEKYGLLVGGAGTHRYDMSSLVMLKDNHVKLSDEIQSMPDMIVKCKQYAGFHCKIEVECQSFEEALTAAQAGADIVMLDNFDQLKSQQTCKQLKEIFPNLLIEASGGIDETNVTGYATDNIDVISMGSLIQGCPIVDYSMKIDLS